MARLFNSQENISSLINKTMDELTLTTCQGENTEPVCTAVADYLSGHLQIPVHFEKSIAWQERLQRLEAGEIEIGWICGSSYVQKLNAAVPFSLLAAPVMMGEEYEQRPVYNSKIIVHQQSDFHSFADLRGAQFAINEPNSYSGCIVVQAHLSRSGERGDYFGSVFESGAHKQSMQWVAGGRVDAAAIDSTLFDYIIFHYPHLQNQVHTIDVLGPSPIPPLVISDVVPEHKKKLIKDLLLQMSKQQGGQPLLASGRVAGFTAVVDEDYDPIRQAAKLATAVQWDIRKSLP